MYIDFPKYKRFFTFGCSLTSYIWPTWADILSKEMPQADFFNFGKAGSGNLTISARIAETNTKFKFTDSDLVIVMWSTLCREDRWIKDSWKGYGNIFNQLFYNKEWVEKYADPVGYLIRDLALIDLANGYMKSNPCTFIQFISESIDIQQDLENPLVKEIIKTYSELISSLTPNFLDLEKNGKWEHTYSYSNKLELIEDLHPTPLDHYGYLKKLGINLTNKSELFAIEFDSKITEYTLEQFVNTMV